MFPTKVLNNRLLRVFLVLFSVIEIGQGIECYSCSSKHDEGCYRPIRNNVPLKKCGKTELEETQRYAAEIDQSFIKFFDVDLSTQDLAPLNCLKQVVTEGTKEYVFRGCQLAPLKNYDICAKMKKQTTNTHEYGRNAFLNTTHCSLCNTRACNGAGTHALNMGASSLVWITLTATLFYISF